MNDDTEEFEATDAEIMEAHLEKRYWMRQVPDDWRLYSWNMLADATYILPSGKHLNVASEHIDLLDRTKDAVRILLGLIDMMVEDDVVPEDEDAAILYQIRQEYSN